MSFFFARTIAYVKIFFVIGIVGWTAFYNLRQAMTRKQMRNVS